MENAVCAFHEESREINGQWRSVPLADSLLRILAWLGSDCVPYSKKVTTDLVLRIEGPGETEFQKMYRIGDKIGQGGFGKVFQCIDLFCEAAEQEPLCVKVVPLGGHRSHRVVKVAEKEQSELLVQCLRMEHPNIVKCHRFIQTDGALYTVMERCSGPDLVDYVRERGERLPIDDIRTIARQILSAVAAVHNCGIMHRDVKPENFRFKDVESKVLQLLDFGFAKPSPGFPLDHSITGTLLYAAPEVFDGHYCRKCDLWSTGVVFYQLFTGHPPFQTSDVQILRSLHKDPVLTGDGLFRGDIRNLIPRTARFLLRDLLVFDPMHRLSASAALEMEWLLDEPDLMMEKSISRSSTLTRDSSQICLHGTDLTDLTSLKRSYFVWDLAASVADEE